MNAKVLEARRRGERRARTQTLDLALRLAELWLRDVLCVCEGAPELVYAVDRRRELERDAAAQDGDGARAARGDRAGRRDAPEPVAERLRGARPRGARLPARVAARGLRRSPAPIGPRLGSRP